MKQGVYKFFVLFFVIFCFFCPKTYALSLSVNSFDGGNSLRFGRQNLPQDFSKEVRIRISADGNSQYQVFQRVLEPFTNDKGEPLDRSVISASTLDGSNSMGTLYLQGLERVGFTDQLVYTSNVTGESDAFTIVYQVNAEEINKSGQFSGKILYIVRPVDGIGQDEMILNVFLDVADELKITSEASSGNNQIKLSTESDSQTQGYLQILFSGNLNQNLRVYQEVIRPVINALNDELNPESLSFFSSGGTNGELDYQNPSQFERGKVLIYESDQAEDTVNINFELNQDALSQQTAGAFAGVVQYSIETQDKAETIDLDLSVDIKPVFELNFDFPQGEIAFDGLLPDAEPRLQEMIVSVRTNLGRPYTVVQKMSGPLTNEKGEEFKAEFFSFQQEVLDSTPGSVVNFQYALVPQSDTEVFISDEAGRPAKFRVIYRLAPYQGMMPGDYKVAVRYSLSEK